MGLKDRHIRAGSHFFSSHLPMYGFDRSPWEAHLFGHHLPHCLLESVGKGELAVRSATLRARSQSWSCLRRPTSSRLCQLDLPVVQSCELVLFLVIPLLSLLAVVLVAQTTTDRAPSRQFLRDVVPFHSISAKLNRELILLGSPLALLLRRSWRFT